jgi:Domain of unknown function (DUF4893)
MKPFLSGLALFFLTVASLTPLGRQPRAEGELPKIITSADREKLDRLGAIRDQAIQEARAKGSKEDLAILEQALSGDALSLHHGFDPLGDWRCRTIKLGKALPIAVYGRFRCRIVDDGSGWRLEKTSGSQRTSGRFYDKNDHEMVYLGVLSVVGDAPVSYGSVAQRNQVAVAVRPGPNRLRLEFPSPVYNSLLDILELERKP